MGMDGGIKITKMSSVRENWIEIKQNLIDSFTRQLTKCASYEVTYLEHYLKGSNALPDSVENLTNWEILKSLNYFSYCDCPYLYEIPGDDLLITGEGDNISSHMITLSRYLDGVSIESWT